jgi:hypothetical protein
MPSTLPPSELGISAATSNEASGDGSKPKYVISQSGHAAHPEEIIASCRQLQAHITKLQEDAERDLREFEEHIRARELAEKRRVAPGWLDSDARLLEPENRSPPVIAAADGTSRHGQNATAPGSEMSVVAGVSEMDTDQGAELDRAFGGLTMREPSK